LSALQARKNQGAGTRGLKERALHKTGSCLGVGSVQGLKIQFNVLSVLSASSIGYRLLAPSTCG
jgi:hypothetical protein